MQPAMRERDSLGVCEFRQNQVFGLGVDNEL